jgi:Protein of unknown function (DUF1566)
MKSRTGKISTTAALAFAATLAASCASSTTGAVAGHDGGAISDGTCSPFTLPNNNDVPCTIVQPCGKPCPAGETCNLTGQCGAPQYTIGNGTVTDNVTGLVWQEPVSVLPCPTLSANGCPWAEAQAYCAGLSLDGMSTGWRLPTVIEIYSLVEPGMSPFQINAAAFPSSKTWWYWSSSPYPGYPGNAWLIAFTNGETYELLVTKAEGVRCVR